MAIISIYAAPFMLSTSAMVLIWVRWGWYVGLPIMFMSFGCYCRYLGALQYGCLVDFQLKDGAEFASYSGLLIWETVAVDSEKNFLCLTTRVFFESLLQLWVQSSFSVSCL